MLTVTVLLVLAAFVCTLAAGIKGSPSLWIAVLLLCLIELLQTLPR